MATEETPILTNRARMFIGASILLFTLIFAALVTLEPADLDLSHYFYLPIALAGIASGPWLGALVGLAANGLYAVALTLDEDVEAYLLDSSTSALRLVTFVGIGLATGALARRNRDLLGHLQEEACRDPLTGLLNLRGFDKAFAGRRERRRPFALLLGDVDGFKEMNDRHGHAYGNEALRWIASTLKTSLRQEDQVARLGGDEFAVLASLTDTNAAGALVEKLERRLLEKGVAMSFGWAIYPDDGDRQTLFERADERLYRSKGTRALEQPDQRLSTVSEV